MQEITDDTFTDEVIAKLFYRISTSPNLRMAFAAMLSDFIYPGAQSSIESKIINVTKRRDEYIASVNETYNEYVTNLTKAK